MQTIRDLVGLRARIGALRADGGTLALVPTMGALHAGHIALIREASALADHVVASIFVNPAQFGPNEDLDAYPRREEEDAAMLAEHGTALLWLPDVAAMYPDGHATRIRVAGVDTVLCGTSRPGHFDGVATIVAKLFNQVRPDVAVFGEKDWQQLAVIRRMARDLDFGLDVVGVPTVRDEDGLALSSRNAYLTPAEREAAVALPAAMIAAVDAVRGSTAISHALAQARAAILAAGFSSIDYLDIRDEDTLGLLSAPATGGRLFVAARIGSTRLIDNIAIG